MPFIINLKNRIMIWNPTVKKNIFNVDLISHKNEDKQGLYQLLFDTRKRLVLIAMAVDELGSKMAKPPYKRGPYL